MRKEKLMTRMVIRMLLCLVIISLYISGCSASEEGDSLDPDSITTFTVTNKGQKQTFHIIMMDGLIREYIARAKDNKMKDLERIYEETVLAPVSSRCYANGVAEWLVNTYKSNPPTDLISLEKALDNEQVNRMIGAAKESLTKSAEQFPGPITNICILPDQSNLKTTIGITPGAGKIIIKYIPDSNISIFNSFIAHEYHHSVWMYKYYDSNRKVDLLENIVMEGKAVYFQTILYPNVVEFPFDDNKELDEEFIKNLHSTDPGMIHQIILGGGIFPPNYGYSKGYEILLTYLSSHPNMTIDEWSQKSAEEIYEGSL
ncbi:hypothetical protein BVG16_22085 [Paenibacillus selenitireducens]|uniref:DUF2268 domain-containing protein n=1 Tax=Paenibacillus selenitireducens TaxID=1324314 RepID=A0A1T2X5Y0_9BACL|nr:DUF2268 domain-containing putative Zn-dependent protease [Paenibacillus selenitireducens]OPA75288.1 hypothetical protein BVG16_22085 [Paenibacillus selenitireducens]